MRSLLKLAVLLIVGILVYNYFFGSVEEKQTSQKVFKETKDLAKGVWNLVKSEKEKFDAGKYDQALDKIGGAFDKLKKQAGTSADLLERIDDLERRKNDLKEKLGAGEIGGVQEYDDTETMNKDLRKLLDDTEKVVDDMEKEEQQRK